MTGTEGNNTITGGILAIDQDISLLGGNDTVTASGFTVITIDTAPTLDLGAGMDIDLADAIASISTAHRIQTQLDIPIVLLTASTDEAVINQAMTISPFGYLVKPFLPEQLQITVDLGMIRYHRLKRIEAEIQGLDRAIC